MPRKKNQTTKSFPTVENRKAKFNFFIEETLECGILLEGSEVKSLRSGKSSIAESYATVENGELWLINSFIPIYSHSKTFLHEEKKPRKLLVKKRELSKLWHAVGRDGMTLVPLRIYFNEKGRAKTLIGIAKGKKAPDKREVEKARDWKKQKLRLLKEKH
tara:strand:+ start:275 stop:754 length:480 start_codon:yes stop_codon:yes gene_type:complete